MGYEVISVEPLSPIVGAEIPGVQLSAPLGNQAFQEVHDALMEHQVVFFRDQEMTLEQHKAFGRLFGELHIHPAAPKPEGHPEILVVHLTAPAECLVERLRSSATNRPSLTDLPLAEEVAQLLRNRLPLYRQVADFELETFPTNVDACCERIVAKIH